MAPTCVSVTLGIAEIDIVGDDLGTAALPTVLVGPAADLQPVFAAEGPQNTGKTLASLTALQELGLIEEQEGRWLPVPVTAKQDLASAPVLQKLAELAKQA